MYMGPAALQRRLVSAACLDASFLADFEGWSDEIDGLATRAPQPGLRSLAVAMRLWLSTLRSLRKSVDARGVRLYCDARQSVTFAMADALCGLLAALSLALDLLQAETGLHAPDSQPSIFFDLGILAAGSAAGRTARICADLLCGSAPRFPVSEVDRRAFARQQADLFMSLRGTMDARERIAEFLRGQPA
jgi:hypothetical protein